MSYEGVEVTHYGANTKIPQENTFLSDFKCWVRGGLGVEEENAAECELGAFSEGISWEERAERYMNIDAVIDWGIYIGGLIALVFILQALFGRAGGLMGYAAMIAMVYLAAGA
jgi:hypothetical protein